MAENHTSGGRPIKPAAAIGVAVALALSVSSCFFPITWDEGEMARRADLATAWAKDARFSVEAMEDAWPGTTTVEGHPQWPVILVAAGKAVAPSVLPLRARYRLGPILFFALALAAVFYRLDLDFDRATATAAVAAVLLIPRLAAHAQIAAWDSTLTASWLLVWATFFPAFIDVRRTNQRSDPRAQRSEAKAVAVQRSLRVGIISKFYLILKKRRDGAALCGVAIGMTLASKFSGAALVPVIVVWLVARLLFDRSFRQEVGPDLLRRAATAAACATATFYLLNPPLWPQPVAGLRTHLALNFDRQINIATLFLGKMYDLHHSLPWYNAFFWIGITLPLGLIVTATVGTAALATKPGMRWYGLFLLLNAAALPAVRMLPGVPVHDGTRLFIPAFAFLAILAGIGAGAMWKAPGRAKAAGVLAVVLIHATCLFNMAWYAPQWLSYYNILIGGLPGAARAGMEPTYYWDGLDGEVLDWINTRPAPDEGVRFGALSRSTLELYRREGSLRTPTFIDARYYVLQRRPSAEYPADKKLIESGQPVFVKTIRRGGWGPWRLDTVPILEIYDRHPH